MMKLGKGEVVALQNAEMFDNTEIKTMRAKPNFLYLLRRGPKMKIEAIVQ